MVIADEVMNSHVIQTGFGQIVRLRISFDGGGSPQTSRTMVKTMGCRSKGMLLGIGIWENKAGKPSWDFNIFISSDEDSQERVLLT